MKYETLVEEESKLWDWHDGNWAAGEATECAAHSQMTYLIGKLRHFDAFSAPSQ